MAMKTKHHILWCTDKSHALVGELAKRLDCRRAEVLRTLLNLGIEEHRRQYPDLYRGIAA